MLPVMFAQVGCKQYERKPVYVVLWLKYEYRVTGVNMTLKGVEQGWLPSIILM